LRKCNVVMVQIPQLNRLSPASDEHRKKLGMTFLDCFRGCAPPSEVGDRGMAAL
jgi:hypothetical protein